MTKTVYDGLGRVSQTQLTSDPEGTDYTDTTYDAMGHIHSVSNPYRSTSDQTYGTTEYAYDALSRVADITHRPDNSVIHTDYLPNCSTVTDEAGDKRKSCSDGIGRLTGVWEDPTNLNYETDYKYDAVGNLTCVEQHGGVAGDFACSDSQQRVGGSWHIRRFTYDSLSRLLRANNPESGLICYGSKTGSTCNTDGYDADGNLVKKTDARNVLTTRSYDALHRLTSKSYSDGTPSPSFYYDETSLWGGQLANSIGRLSHTELWTPQGCADEMFSYDAVGRIIADWPSTPSNCGHGAWVLNASYDLAGHMTAFTYPSGRTVNLGYNLAGWPQSAIDADRTNYVISATHAPTGSLTGFVNGYSGSYSGIQHTLTYSPRLQVGSIAASTPNGQVLGLSYSYGTQNNGNIQSITNTLNPGRTQTFDYDSMNRVSHAYSNNSSGPESWGNTYGYDAWGNLLQKSSYPNRQYYESFSAAVDPNNPNRLTGYTYDASGNMTQSGSATYTYDAESRLASGSGATYIYDADGQRVRKDYNGATEYIYFGGNVIAEKNVIANTWTDSVFFAGQRAAYRSSDGTYYYVDDHLGTSRMIVKGDGTVCYNAVYYPWGAEQNVFTNTCDQHYKFTGKERDAETGLDYFGARYYGSTMGRWLSPDAPFADQDENDPQSWNLYNYVRNNPLIHVDLDGRECKTDDKGDVKCDVKWPKDKPPAGPPPKDDHVTPLGLGPFDILFIRVPNLGIGARIGGWVGRAAENTVGNQIQRLGLQGAAELANKLEAQTIVAQAASVVGNQGVKASSRAIAEQAAKDFVGDAATPIVERSTGAQVGWKSADGTRIVRFTSANKPSPYINLVNKTTGGNLHVRF